VSWGDAICAPVHERRRCGKAVDGGEGEVLGLAVVPAETHEDAEVLRDFLFRADAEAVFERAGRSTLNVGVVSRGGGDLQRRAVAAGSVWFEIAQAGADSARMRKRVVAPFAFELIAAVDARCGGRTGGRWRTFGSAALA
jgi:hypothetical protein